MVQEVKYTTGIVPAIIFTIQLHLQFPGCIQTKQVFEVVPRIENMTGTCYIAAVRVM